MINNENFKEYQHYFTSYFGRTPEYYTKRVEWYLQGKRNSFNIYAFFFNNAWLFFRKMYKPFFLIILAFFILVIIAETLLLLGVISSSTHSDLNILYFFLVPTVTGCFANRWYIKRSIKAVEEAIANTDENFNANEYLEKKGGTSMTALIIFLIISITLNVIVSFFE